MASKPYIASLQRRYDREGRRAQKELADWLILRDPLSLLAFEAWATGQQFTASEIAKAEYRPVAVARVISGEAFNE